VAILRVDKNFEYSNRCEDIAQSFHHLKFPVATLREVLADGVTVQQLVNIAQAAAR
jgi:hypothetical protein